MSCLLFILFCEGVGFSCYFYCSRNYAAGWNECTSQYAGFVKTWQDLCETRQKYIDALVIERDDYFTKWHVCRNKLLPFLRVRGKGGRFTGRVV